MAYDIIFITEVHTKTVLDLTPIIGFTQFSDVVNLFMVFMVCVSIFQNDQSLNHSGASQNYITL